MGVTPRATIAVLTLASAVLAPAEPIFEEHVRPILKANCFHCHGEGGEMKGKLDLRLRRLMVEPAAREAVLVPGEPDKSRLIAVLREGEMPKGEKKLSPEQIELIERWVAAGAPTQSAEPAEAPEGFFITRQEREFWSFQPIKRPEVPQVGGSSVRSAIDQFILAKLQEQGLTFAPEADKPTLIRRAYLDLLGLPPAPEEVDEFVADHSPDAYERLVDRLLDSPHYGERWARHWLDVAGYADSNGFAEADSVRPHAWRYRDYVIRAHNEDKPWSEFIQEQLAGDELAGVTEENAVEKARDSRVRELLEATGFLRAAPDGTADEIPDQKLARNSTVAETIKIVSSSLLGMTVGCAQCHDHRYEPIAQVDYYRFRALFEPAFDTKNWRNPNQTLVSLYTAEDRKKAEEIESEAKKIDEEANRMRKEFLEQVFEKEIAKLPEEVREVAREARNTQRSKRTPEQVALLKTYPSADVQGALDLYDPALNKKVQEKQGEAGKVRGTKPAEPFVFCVTERAGKVPETFVFHRGDHEQPKEKVAAEEIEILRSALARWQTNGASFGSTNLASSGRRLAYARWLTSGQHPLVARVLVNRFWLNHFGRGLVSTPADFGMQGERPSHPELLDWLASEFMRGGWRLKSFHRMVMNSTVYRQSSQNDEAARLDPENRLLGRMKLQRFDSETLRDAILAVSGGLNREQFGPGVPIAGDEAGRVVTGIQKTNGNGDPVLVEPIGERAFRRSIYVQTRRSMPLTILDSFDAPVMTPNCELRNSSTVAPQALTMLNDSFVAEQATLFARRVQTEFAGDAAGQLRRAWRLAYGTAPQPEAVTSGLVFLAEQAEQIRTRSEELTAKKKTVPSDPQTLALASYCQALLSANPFLYRE
jgi:hypothetical protein